MAPLLIQRWKDAQAYSNDLVMDLNASIYVGHAAVSDSTHKYSWFSIWINIQHQWKADSTTKQPAWQPMLIKDYFPAGILTSADELSRPPPFTRWRVQYVVPTWPQCASRRTYKRVAVQADSCVLDFECVEIGNCIRLFFIVLCVVFYNKIIKRTFSLH